MFNMLDKDQTYHNTKSNLFNDTSSFNVEKICYIKMKESDNLYFNTTDQKKCFRRQWTILYQFTFNLYTFVPKKKQISGNIKSQRRQ